MLKLRRGDTVYVTKGKDSGKKGKVLRMLLANKKALVEGINMVKKHKRRTQQDQQGGIVSIETPISIANLLVVCKNCSNPARIGFMILKDGTKTRICKSCKEPL
jgi:large subunit ribosomal protein L24